MGCKVRLVEKPELNDPILIEGLPGIGLVANITVAYLIKKLDVKFFGEIQSTYFPDISLTEKEGTIKSPFCHFYYYKQEDEHNRDLILLYGNTQALTRRGQYDICGNILKVVENLGCHHIITLGGYRPGKKVDKPNLYFAASDLESAQKATNLGAKILTGQIYGIAGLLVGLAPIYKINGFCLLAETAGTHLDVIAAREILRAISGILGLQLYLEDLKDANEFADFLSPFDFGALSKKHRKIETKPDWFI